MEDFELTDVSFNKLDNGYSSQWELVSDLFHLVDHRLYLYYKYHRWLGPDNDMRNMLGLVVSRDEFEAKLAKSAQMGLSHTIGQGELSDLKLTEDTIQQRIEKTQAAINLLELFERFDLDEFERNAVILAYVAELDGKYERLFAYLQDDITKKTPSVSLAVQLYIPKGSTVEEFISFFTRETAFTSLFDSDDLKAGNLRLKPAVSEFLSSGEIVMPSGMSFYDGLKETPEDPIVTGSAVSNELDASLKSRRDVIIVVSGPAGSGKRFQIKHLCSRQGLKCLFVDLSVSKSAELALSGAQLLGRLLNACICFSGIERKGEDGTDVLLSPSLLSEISRVDAERVFITSVSETNHGFDRPLYLVAINPTTLDDRMKLIEHYLPDGACENVPHQELAGKFRFEAAQIKQAATQVAGVMGVTGSTLDAQSLHRCFYMQVVHKLDKLARRVTPHYTWDDVVLPEPQLKILKGAVSHIKYQHKVFSQWGFNKKLNYGKGLSTLFAGAPGTGKTMCAQILAGELNMELYKINISQVVSKYIGETEKNLHEVFKEARNSSSVLFFDECDALFSKRSEVKDSHDRNANVEVAYLLQQIEEHDGVCILASNLMQNIDAAFMRRITYVVHFPFPDPSARKEIYLKILPENMPLDKGIDWDFIADKFNLSGGHIKNIVLSAAFMSAADDRPMTMQHILTAAVNELKKNEIVVVREQLQEYADLIL